ncbi:type 2 lanthipeptide synthetase LanM family protein [Halalkalibacter alkalisediminis]|uniref:Type 2 lanthipeptide synthetase LanM family protein n=1 Tax=Halalkalibacter alkalisediminis TaxID=935616 RepID=A0ABV6NL32_9BACI|nr:type 2 lanthipeptide synthetase LanM family protein [Halalkalibacter alkalisediminis]
MLDLGKDTDQKWFQALYLDERKQLDYRELKLHFGRISDWIERSGLFSYDLLNERVKHDGLTVNEFKKIISNPHVVCKGKELAQNTWVQFIYDAFHQNELVTISIDEVSKEHHVKPFFELIIPILQYTKRLIMNETVERPETLDVIDQVTLLKAILTPLAETLLKVVSKTLIFELNKARLQKELVGLTREDRYRFFVTERLENRGKAYELLLEYPVLGRLIAEASNLLVQSVFTTLDHWISDNSKVAAFFGQSFTKIQSIELKGDVHNSGRAVLELTFEQTKLLYKPHSLEIDVHFQEFLQWINNKGVKNTLPLLRVCHCQDHGWVEYVEHQACSTKEEVHRFYERQGNYLAILYLLGATDFHHENIVAAGEKPYLVDLESLFHNKVGIRKEKATATDKAHTILQNSVMNTALLPVRVNNPRFVEANFSGLGTNSGFVSVYTVENSHTDEMFMKKQTLFIKPERTHQPSFQGEYVSFEDYTEEIIRGFKEMYLLFSTYKEELLSLNGPIYMFKEDQIRTIFRPTYFYGRLLEAGKHPKYLKNGLMRVQLFDLLWKGNDSTPDVNRIAHSESSALLQEDVPYFYTYTNSKDIYDQFHKRIPEYFEQTALEIVLQNVEKLSMKDLDQQIEFINASFHTNSAITTEKTDHNMQEAIPFKQEKPFELPSVKGSLLSEAVRIGKKIAQLGVWSEDEETISWLSMGVTRQGNLEYSVMKLGLYDGILGMALFYSYLYKYTNDDEFKRIANASVNTVLGDFAHNEKVGLIDHSAYLGYAGVLYVFMHVYKILERDELLDEADALLDKIWEMAAEDKQYDLLSGNAGVIIVALSFYEVTGNSKALQVAIDCGELLLKQAHKTGKMVYWKSNDFMMQKPPETGFSHGTAGIAYSLSQLYIQTKDERYLAYIDGALLYENSLYDLKKGNWANQNNTERLQEEKTYSFSWCNGAAGIGLSRLEMANYFPDNQSLKADVQRALHAILKGGMFKDSDCLCHGKMGSFEFLFKAALVMNDTEMQQALYQQLLPLINEAKEKNWWDCGFADKYIIPNLMVGLAGVGFQLMRFYEPQTPSVLLLEGPSNKEGE